MSDTLIMVSEANGSLCCDILEPDRPRLAIFFDDLDELSRLLLAAYDEGRVDAESCRHALDDGLAALINHEARRREWKSRPRRCMEVERTPQAGGYLVSEAWKGVCGVLLCIVAALTFAVLWGVRK